MLGKAFNKAKELGSKGLHEAQRRTAVDVLNKTQNKVSGKSKDILDKARVLVVNKYKDGGVVEKTYNEQSNVGKSKYVVNHYDGEKKHKDGSPFFDIAIFKNIKDKNNFIAELKSKGYKPEYKNGGGVGFRNIDKIKSNIGETVFNHINSLNKSQLEKQLSELKSELKSESKNTERNNKLKDEEWYILYRLERSSEFEYKKGGAVKKKSLMSMANLVIADMRAEKIKDWYIKNHPTDDLGEYLNDDVTFSDLMNALNNKKEIYEFIGVGDSVIRERLFERLTSIYDESYDTIHKKWLASDKYEDGGSTKGFNYSIGGL
jgi:hypothetical protein